MKFFLIISNLFLLVLNYFKRLFFEMIISLLFRQIKKIIENKEKKILNIVFDFQTNNPTFGEYVWIMFFAKYLKLKKKKINIILIDDYSKNSDFQSLPKNNILLFKKELTKITYLFLKKKFVVYSNFKEFNLDFNDKKHEILFSFFIFKRLSIHSYFIRLMNLLMSNEKKIFINKMLLKTENTRLTKKFKKLKPYIAWHIRKNEKWGSYNNNKNEILKIIKYLKLQKSNYKILIVSDKKTCIWARNILKNYKNVYFTDKISNGYVNSASAVINSDYFFQFKAGGMTPIAYMTNVPYKIVSYFNPLDRAFSKNKAVSWQQNNQIRVYNYKKINLEETVKGKL